MNFKIVFLLFWFVLNEENKNKNIETVLFLEMKISENLNSINRINYFAFFVSIQYASIYI